MTLMISGGGGGGGATALSGLSDVTLAALANGQILQYDSGTGQWGNTALTGQLTYKGSFNATAGTPALTNALKGDFYVISVAGTQFGVNWSIGDHLIVNDDMGGVIDPAKIDKIDNTDAVSSVNGATGVVVLDSDDVAEGAVNLYYTDARADARIAASNMTALADVSYTAGAGIDNYVLTYDHAAGGWRAEVVASAPVDSVNGATGVVVLDSDDVAEGAVNLYYTDARADARADARIAASNMTALADVSYTAGAGIDNYILTYDHAAGGWRAEAAASAPVDSVNGATGVVVLDSDDVAEGAVNLYYTDARADARADARIAASNMTALADVSYTAGAGIDNYILTYDHAAGGWRAEAAASAPVDSVNGATGVVVLDSDDVAEGAVNLYYTDARADARADARIAASNMTALADVSYTAGAGIDNYVLTYDHAAGGWRAEAAASGGSRPNVYTQSASFTIGDGTGTDPGAVTAAELERVYIINNGASAVTVTLPLIAGNVGAGYKLQIKRLGSAVVTVGRNGNNIDGLAADASLSVQYSSLTICCAGGSDWYII